MRLEITILLSLCVSGLLCWGALRTAQAIAAAQRTNIEMLTEEPTLTIRP